MAQLGHLYTVIYVFPVPASGPDITHVLCTCRWLSGHEVIVRTNAVEEWQQYLEVPPPLPPKHTSCG